MKKTILAALILATSLTAAAYSSAAGPKAVIRNAPIAGLTANHHSLARWHAERRHAAAVRRAERRAQHARLLSAWGRVAVCEEGGWIGRASSEYPNSLGILAGGPGQGGWYGHGGGSDVRPWAQIKVARLEVLSMVGQTVQGVVVYPGFVPPEEPCRGW